MMVPPTTAPGTESSPPRMTTGNTSSPNALIAPETPMRFATSAPPKTALTPASAHASANVRRTLMPYAIARARVEQPERDQCDRDDAEGPQAVHGDCGAEQLHRAGGDEVRERPR